ncbi:MAG: response regulator [Holophagales bacterium]|jgi:CheY-like chemotaxis protein|nr:response regulator [Holophagales bacterium]
MTLSTEMPLVTNTPDKSRIVLLVEDDRATQSLLQAGLRELSEYQVIIADNGVEALEVLKKQIVNVIVTDLNMPVMNGFELISIIYDLYPHIPVLVMTGSAKIPNQNAPLSMRVLRILPKPIKLSALAEQVKEAAEYKPDRIVQGIPLNDFLQLMEWELKTCALAVESEENMGMLYIQNGALLHASFKEFEGLDAAYKILNWACPRIQFKNACLMVRTINIPLTELLLNAAKRKDSENDAPSG